MFDARVPTPNGLTVAELKRIVASMPEKNEAGEDFTVWVETGFGLSSVVVEISPLNKRDDGCDLHLASRVFDR